MLVFVSIDSHALTIENLTVDFSYNSAVSELIFVHICVHQELESLKIDIPRSPLFIWYSTIICCFITFGNILLN